MSLLNAFKEIEEAHLRGEITLHEACTTAVAAGGLLVGTVETRAVHEPAQAATRHNGEWYSFIQGDEGEPPLPILRATQVPEIAVLTGALGDVNQPAQRTILNRPLPGVEHVSVFGYGHRPSGYVLRIAREVLTGLRALQDPMVIGYIDVVRRDPSFVELKGGNRIGTQKIAGLISEPGCFASLRSHVRTAHFFVFARHLLELNNIAPID